MMEMIDREAERAITLTSSEDQEEWEVFNPVFIETLEHAHQCVTKVERFHGREDVLTNIHTYIMSDSAKPFVIFGESGCGKTSVLAKAAMQVCRP